VHFRECFGVIRGEMHHTRANNQQRIMTQSCWCRGYPPSYERSAAFDLQRYWSIYRTSLPSSNWRIVPEPFPPFDAVLAKRRFSATAVVEVMTSMSRLQVAFLLFAHR
jgi:hypothetical protein